MDVVRTFFRPSGSRLARLEAPIKWYAKNEGDVAVMGLSLVNVWSLFQLYPQRWPFVLNLLSWIPSIRNGYLIVKTKIEPLL
ncbi:hypothetical protein F7734_22985 [Scytonema sp. UIC 10036]|uniref:hypothetical protein n=1 Tax=Scytonema sp. UIC 10036 TaxID=2304196 RepID=UPI0012DADEDD|nr:hypothetical protein [Scytonema sp. UIC 10036]MUG95072.1 hypothetical protein [Scytonema sp. UIC 10036]